MAIELYRKEFQRIDENHTREMVASLVMVPGSKKIGSVHISPVTIEDCGEYKMELTRASDRCITLHLSKPYILATQWGKMMEDVRAKAEDWRSICYPTSANCSPEVLGFWGAIDYLSTEKLTRK